MRGMSVCAPGNGRVRSASSRTSRCVTSLCVSITMAERCSSSAASAVVAAEAGGAGAALAAAEAGAAGGGVGAVDAAGAPATGSGLFAGAQAVARTIAEIQARLVAFTMAGGVLRPERDCKASPAGMHVRPYVPVVDLVG